MPFATTWVTLESRERPVLHGSTYMWNLKKKTKKKQVKLPEAESRKGLVGWGWGKWGEGAKGYKLSTVR